MTWRAMIIGAVVGTTVAWLSMIETMVMMWVPSSWWLEVHELHVDDARVGEVPRLRVLRRVHRPVTGNWTKTVRQVVDERLVTVCERTGSTDFLPEAELPHDIDLDWWMSGPSSCAPMQPGRYVLTTVWLLQIPGRLPKELRLVSNVFEVRE